MIWVGERPIERTFSIMVENAPELKKKEEEQNITQSMLFSFLKHSLYLSKCDMSFLSKVFLHALEQQLSGNVDLSAPLRDYF